MKLKSLKFALLIVLTLGVSTAFAEGTSSLPNLSASGEKATSADGTSPAETPPQGPNFGDMPKVLQNHFVTWMPATTLRALLKVDKLRAGFATQALLKSPDLADRLDALVVDLENESPQKRAFAVEVLSRNGALSQERAIRLLDLATQSILREGGGGKFQAKLAATQILREQFRQDAGPIKRYLEASLVALSLGSGAATKPHDRIAVGMLVQMLGIDLPSDGGMSTEREGLIREIEALRAQARAREGLLMAPSREDLVTHLDYLGQEDRGVIRLMPRGLYDSILQISQAGAYYSFFRLVHDYGYGSDLELQSGELSVGFAGADFGFLVRLGEVDLKDVSLEPLTHPALEFANSFVAPLLEPEARESYRTFGAGIKVGDYDYRNRLRAEVGQVYALRSVSYDRSDVLVVFKVLRQDSDGSLILLWKKLREFAVPQLRRN